MSMAKSGSSADTEDPWGLPSSQVLSSSHRVPARAPPVPDDWDADDDEDEDEQDPQTLWETANARAPMPLIQASTTSLPVGTQLPPAAALEAPLRILKRPSGAGSKSASPLSGAQTPKSLKEREAQYQAARERIFGEEERDKAEAAGSNKPTSHAPDRSNIIRDPTGPTSRSVDGEPIHGFGTRKKKGGHDTSVEFGYPKVALHESSGKA